MEDFNWKIYPEAERFLQEKLTEFLSKNDFSSKLAQELNENASLRMFDLIDHIVIPKERETEDYLFSCGYEIDEDFKLDNPDLETLYVHKGATLFPIIVIEEGPTEFVLRTDSLAEFIQMLEVNVPMIGEAFSPFRYAVITPNVDDFILSAIERRGYSGFSRIPRDSLDRDEYILALDAFMTRSRQFSDDYDGLSYTLELVQSTVSKLGTARACDAFFRAERQFWQNRDPTGQVQKNRQDQFGLGWTNHDHHTYRSSRSGFVRLIEILETLGFERREQFFAGQQAGWGAQVLEHQDCGIVVFADVDITDGERGTDFAITEMSELDRLGTVGLWVALHGESMLQGGLHHLAIRVDFEAARRALEKQANGILPPFSDFEFLKQSFSKTNKRKINPNRIKSLQDRGMVSADGAKTFIEKGAIGSHLEIIQRNQGFKGFNQESVTAIIQATDPRKS